MLANLPKLRYGGFVTNFPGMETVSRDAKSAERSAGPRNTIAPLRRLRVAANHSISLAPRLPVLIRFEPPKVILLFGVRRHVDSAAGRFHRILELAAFGLRRRQHIEDVGFFPAGQFAGLLRG